MADVTLSPPSPAATDDNCGCCRPPEARTTGDLIRELEARRDAVDARLDRVDTR